MWKLTLFALLTLALVSSSHAQVPENFECPPGVPQFDSFGLSCEFTTEDWLQCVYDNLEGAWRLGCLNSSRFSPPVPIPVQPPPVDPGDFDIWLNCEDVNAVAPPYYDVSCLFGNRTCLWNPITNEFIVNCTCPDDRTGLRCEHCTADSACAVPGQAAEEALPCNTGPQPVVAKYYECNATDQIIRDQLGGGRIAALIEPQKGTGSVIIYTRESGPPPLFTCNVTSCVYETIEESGDLLYTYRCDFTTCECPKVPGTDRCKDQATEDTVAIIKTKASVRCRDRAPRLECVFDQTELGVVINVECFASECAVPPPFVSQLGAAIGQLVGVFCAILVVMALPALIYLIFTRVAQGRESLAPRHGAAVEFASVRYSIDLGAGAWLPRWARCGRCAARPQTVLHDVYGAAYPGELVAIMGESGSGKTSLLDILAGMEKTGRVRGVIRIDGKPRPRDFKVECGYVQQFDAMLGTLTVEEQLRYSAELRLPANVSRADKEALVQQTMQELGLSHKAHTRIGSSEKRGISGGEKRRASIATELVSQPRVLFLDEPTSGLDSSRALSVMTLLKQLTQRQQQTIICSIHQPRSNIFQLFDRVILLAKGRVIYSGPRDQVIDFFRQNGYKCPKGFNHADFLIDTVTAASDDRLEELAAKAREFYATLPAPKLDTSSASSAKRGARPGWLVQVAMLTHRAFVNLWRNPVLLKTHTIATLIIAIFLGLAYLGLTNNISGFQNRAGSLFFVITMLSFSCLTALDLFISERPIFIRERANGAYEAGPYFLAKVFTDLMPLRVLLPTIFATIVFWMAGYSSNMAHYVRFLLVIVLVNFTSAALLFVLSALTRSLAAATFISSILILVQLLFSGLLLNFASIPVYIRWLRYLSFLGYAYEAAIVNELQNLAIDVDVSVAQAQGGLTLSGSLFLEAFAFKVDNFWADILILFSYGVLYLVLAYVALRIFVKYKS